MEASEIHISVTGQKCCLLDSDLSPPIDRSLQRWNDSEEHDLWVSAYDVRMLCDQYSDFHTRRGAASALEQEDKHDDDFAYDDIMYERYQDMLDVKECDLMKLPAPFTAASTTEDDNGVHVDGSMTFAPSPAASTLPYSYDEQVTTMTDPFVQPIHPFPSHVKHFPETMKHYNIILHTAHAVRNNPQLEILLKVKQKGNPMFYFLNEDVHSRSDLFQLYSYLRNLDDKTFWKLFLGKCTKETDLCEVSEKKEMESVGGACGSNALSLLGAYSESEGEDEGKEEIPADNSDTIVDAEVLVTGTSTELEEREVRDMENDDEVDSSASTMSLNDSNTDTASDTDSNCNTGQSIDHDQCIENLLVQSRIVQKKTPCTSTTNNFQSNEYDFSAATSAAAVFDTTGTAAIAADSDSDNNGDMLDSDMLDSDIDEQTNCFWTRKSRIRNEQKEKQRVAELGTKANQKNLQEEMSVRNKRRERLQRAKLLSGHFLLGTFSASSSSSTVALCPDVTSSSDSSDTKNKKLEVGTGNRMKTPAVFVEKGKGEANIADILPRSRSSSSSSSSEKRRSSSLEEDTARKSHKCHGHHQHSGDKHSRGRAKNLTSSLAELSRSSESNSRRRADRHGNRDGRRVGYGHERRRRRESRSRSTSRSRVRDRYRDRRRSRDRDSDVEQERGVHNGKERRKRERSRSTSTSRDSQRKTVGEGRSQFMPENLAAAPAALPMSTSRTAGEGISLGTFLDHACFSIMDHLFVLPGLLDYAVLWLLLASPCCIGLIESSFLCLPRH